MRNFQQHQQDAEDATYWLVIFLVLAVLGTIVLSSLALATVAVGSTYGYLLATVKIRMSESYWMDLFYQRLWESSVLTVLAVVGTALYRTLQSSGPAVVARAMGGERVLDSGGDAANRQLLNVVEEMAIATGVRPPQVYVLEEEPGINAFAAGWDAKEAAIGVTRGAVDRLERHQLQGVVAHEFSHILHGDMRVNSRLMGVLAGIQAITSAARFLLQLGLGRSTASGRQDRFGGNPLAMAIALVFGAALWPIGQIGALFATLITMAVNRQREFLADASAVQYTRDPNGLREALQVILADQTGSGLTGTSAMLASHMCFAAADAVWNSLLQTHPPLEERIRRLGSSSPQLADSAAPEPSAEPGLAELSTVLAE